MQNFFTKLDSPTGSGGVSAPPTTSSPDDSAPWYLRYAAKGAGVFGGIGEAPSLLKTLLSLDLMVAIMLMSL
jgi:hypothetical protein